MFKIIIAHIQTIYKIIKWLILSIYYYGCVHWFDCFCTVAYGTNVNFSIESDDVTATNIKKNIEKIRRSTFKNMNVFDVDVNNNVLNISYDHTYIDGLVRANILKNLIIDKEIVFEYKPNRTGTNLSLPLLYDYLYSSTYNYSLTNQTNQKNWFNEMLKEHDLQYFLKKYKIFNASATAICVGLVTKYFCLNNKKSDTIVFHMFVNKRIGEKNNKKNNECVDGRIMLGNYIDFIQFEFSNDASLDDIVSNMSVTITNLKNGYDSVLKTNKPTKKPHFIINSWFFISSIMKVKLSNWTINYEYTEEIDNSTGSQSYFIIVSPSNFNTAAEIGTTFKLDLEKWRLFVFDQKL